ncbi:fibrinogen-like 2a [Callorhinchus milii]|uniref:Fibrinogen-like 2 n=1 Tax=Callorhinchus milii TaxID=7868 RepID=V9KKV3_CALMI|nr:fibrinogen-like 2a [Callorhinchus milii]|eukprot:gi/632947528/ref/XP_007889090.1/ PREDICTED: fibroleukin [Callorhinchus milii]
MKTALVFLNVGLIVCIEKPLGYGISSFKKTENKVNGACSIKLKPAECSEDKNCGYQVNLPPLTIQLPKQSKLLEKTVKNLNSLTATVNKMKNKWMGEKKKKITIDSEVADSSEVNDSGLENDDRIKVLEEKVTKLVVSLRNAKNQIKVLQGRLEGMSDLNLDNMMIYINHELSKINSTVNRLNNKCFTTCAAASQPIEQRFQDCSGYYYRGYRQSGIYKIAPGFNEEFPVYCDMQILGGGWTVLQARKDMSVSFNRSWEDYKKGFGNLSTSFWLGNDKIHLLTRSRNMTLRIELEDWEGIKEFAKYDQFHIANESQFYRLTIKGYFGTAGDAMHYSKHYNHDQRYFTTRDKDNDRYPSGNCGAYYASGWWFDACMSANLNGKYYRKSYKGIRNGIFWGTWNTPKIETLNGYRHAFKSVRMLVRPIAFVEL